MYTHTGHDVFAQYECMKNWGIRIKPFKELYWNGVNLGGWISQYAEGLQMYAAHFDTFIRENDLEQIAGWGFDHVRLPVDYMIFEKDSAPGVYDEDGLKHIDDCVRWCKNYGLNVIIDLHHAPGFSFHTLDTNTLFTDPDMGDRMSAIWVNFAKRYLSQRDNVAFELMNEIVEPDSVRWNDLAARLVADIRAVDPNRYIIIGGNNYNAVSELRNIRLIPEDDRIVYTFHFYEPILFTHQLAGWNAVNMAYGEKPLYPAVFPHIREFVGKYPEYAQAKALEDLFVDINVLREMLQPAVDFIQNTGRTLYCGEYGVIDHTDPESRRNWHRDFITIMDGIGIGRAVWSYKLMGFKLVERDGSVADQALVDVIRAR